MRHVKSVRFRFAKRIWMANKRASVREEDDGRWMINDEHGDAVLHAGRESGAFSRVPFGEYDRYALHHPDNTGNSSTKS